MRCCTRSHDAHVALAVRMVQPHRVVRGQLPAVSRRGAGVALTRDRIDRLHLGTFFEGEMLPTRMELRELCELALAAIHHLSVAQLKDPAIMRRRP